jgi:hypothetical protein
VRIRYCYSLCRTTHAIYEPGPCTARLVTNMMGRVNVKLLLGLIRHRAIETCGEWRHRFINFNLGGGRSWMVTSLTCLLRTKNHGTRWAGDWMWWSQSQFWHFGEGKYLCPCWKPNVCCPAPGLSLYLDFGGWCLVFTYTCTQCHNPEEHNQNLHLCYILKCFISFLSKSLFGLSCSVLVLCIPCVSCWVFMTVYKPTPCTIYIKWSPMRFDP